MTRYEKIYIRFRGRTLGPITQAKAEDLIRRHQITKQHELSADSVSWRPAQELFPDEFANAKQQEEAKDKGEHVEQAVEQPTAAQVVEPQWYAIVNGKRTGPVSESTIRTWVGLGTIQPESKVWQDGLPDYVDAGSIRPEWFFGKRSKAEDEDKGQLVWIGEKLLAGKRWALLFAVVGLTYWAFSVIGCTIWLLGLLTQQTQDEIVGVQLVSCLLGIGTSIIFFIGFFFLLRFVQSLTPLQFGADRKSITHVLDQLSRFWVYAGISSLVLLCIVTFFATAVFLTTLKLA